jgi:hypothetical protein
VSVCFSVLSILISVLFYALHLSICLYISHSFLSPYTCEKATNVGLPNK